MFVKEMNGGWRDWGGVWEGPTHACKPAAGQFACHAKEE